MGLAQATLLPWSEHIFGTKRDVTPFIKPVDRGISFIERPFPLSSRDGFKYSEYNIEHLYMVSHLFKWPFVIYSLTVPYLALFVRELGDEEY